MPYPRLNAVGSPQILDNSLRIDTRYKTLGFMSRIDRDINHILGGLLRPSRVMGDRRPSRNLTEGVGAYTSAQSDPVGFGDYLNRSHSYDRMDLASVLGSSDAAAGAAALTGDPLLAVFGSVLGIGRDLLGYAHADISAKVAYERQNDFYDNHLSMPAKVQEFEQAGLNPMALGSSGVGATSAPSVQAGNTPSGESAFFGLLNTLLDYKLKNRELDIADRRVDVDSHRVDLEEQRLPSLIDQSLALAENRRKQNEWYNATIEKMSHEVKLMDEHIKKVFQETEQVKFENFFLQEEGKVYNKELSLKLQNLAKDLGVKDSTIYRNYAESASAWARTNLDYITSLYQGELMQSQTAENNANAQYKVVESAVEQFKYDYRSKHAGTDPPAGMVGAVVSVCAQIARNFTTGITFGLVKEDINPNF